MENDGPMCVGGSRTVATAGTEVCGTPHNNRCRTECATAGTVPGPPDGDVCVGGSRTVATAGTEVCGTPHVSRCRTECATAGTPHVSRCRTECATAGTVPGPPARKHPSKNSVMTIGNRSVILFVTVTAHDRQPVFANSLAVELIHDCWQKSNGWIVGQYVIMPDHIHFFCAPEQWPIPDFHQWLSFWKTCVSKSFPIEHHLPLFQRDCWDTQMRTADGYREKWHYVRNNPVRKGLVANADDWLYQGCLNTLEWHDA